MREYRSLSILPRYSLPPPGDGNITRRLSTDKRGFLLAKGHPEMFKEQIKALRTERTMLPTTELSPGKQILRSKQHSRGGRELRLASGQRSRFKDTEIESLRSFTIKQRDGKARRLPETARKAKKQRKDEPGDDV